MKLNKFEKRFVYVAFHQVFTVAMIICVYAYDYALRIDIKQNEMIYLLIGFFGLLGSIASVAGFTVTEIHIVKKQKEVKGLDKWSIEILLIVGIGIILLLLWPLLIINIEQFTLIGLLITVGVITYLIDVIILLVYFSIVHRVVRKQFLSNSFLYDFLQMLMHYEKGVGIRELSQKSKEQIKLKEALEKMSEGEIEMTLNIEEFHGQEKEMALAINRIQSGLKQTIDNRMKDEKMKADLITNISHDIKTPLTSIVNYVELLKREQLESKEANRYVRIISDKANRLKTLTEDLVEISRISSGNIHLEMQTIDFKELLYQAGGEFNERFETCKLTIVTKMSPEMVLIEADGRQLYRIVENLYSNAAKYSLENTTIYVELMVEDTTAIFRIKNIAKYNIEIASGDYTDLTERFVRGEISRTTEGSGLGLSIAKTLTNLMGGEFAIRVDRDMFMAQVKFPVKNSR